jgi:heme exporter protein A
MSRTLEAKGLECVRGGRMLFHDLSFSLEEGELIEVSGANGSGKTSLLRILSTLLSPTAGEILWQNTPIASLRDEYLDNLIYVGHANGVKGELSAAENLRVYSGLAGASRDEAKIHKALHRVGLGECELSPAKTLSQGQQRRIALSRLLITSRTLWILDEPLAALDDAGVRLVESLLLEHLDAGGMVLMTTHQHLSISAQKTTRIQLTTSSEH